MVNPINNPSLTNSPAIQMARKVLDQQKQDGQNALSLIYGTAVQQPQNLPGITLPPRSDGRGTIVNTYL